MVSTGIALNKGLWQRLEGWRGITGEWGSTIYQLCISSKHWIHHHITCTNETYEPRCSFSEETEALPTDQLWLVLSSEEKQVPIWSPLDVLQKHSVELLGISVSHSDHTGHVSKNYHDQVFGLNWGKEVNKDLSSNAHWGTLKKTGKAQWQQILNE